MASRSASRNNILAGLFLLVGVALAVTVSIVLSGASDALNKQSVYTVLFSLADGATGIKKGSMVLLGGQPIGKVRAVNFQPAPARDGAAPDPGSLDIAVEIGTRADVTFYTNADFYLERPLLGSLSTINIGNMGRPGVNGSARLEEHGTIRGKLAPPSFLAQAGVGSEQVSQVQELISSANKSVSRLSTMIDRYEPKIDRIVADADGIVHRVSDRVPAWTEAVDGTLTDARGAARNFQPLVESASTGVEEAREIVRKADAIVDDGGPKVSAILDSLARASDKLDRTTIDGVNRSLEQAQATLDVVARVGNELSALLREESPNVRRLLANARLASDQLKFAAIEIRSQPWRLLYSPTPKETETSVLYDTARNYAQAVSDLRAASEALEATAGANSTPGGSPGALQASDRQSIEELNAELRHAFERYHDAERALLDRLVRQGGRSAPATPQK